MRKFKNGRRIGAGLALAAAVLVALVIFYGTGGSAVWRTALAVVVAGLLLALLWALGRVRRQRDEHLRSDSLRDSLTDLPNRVLFVERADNALQRAVGGPGSIAVLLVDLDNFEEINHSLGHDAGDRLLVVVSERLRESVGREAMVARLCSDEFAVLLERIPDKNAAALVAERIGDALKAPVGLDGSEVLVSATVGISLAGSDQDSPEGLLRKADVAMHAAKAQGKACYKVFDPDASTTTSGRLLLESEMRRAVREEEFVVYYQPLVALETGEVRGMEALVRWRHPVYGLVPPGEFIPLAEQTGLIAPLGRWVLREACRQARLWHEEKQSSSSLVLSVNVSACQFRQPNLVEEVHRALKETGLDPRCLKLEITESVMMHDAAAIAALWELKGSGIELAMDDFGTGYSNLSYLKRLPIDTLKIDRSYISGLSHDTEDTAIVHATVAFARALNLNVTAEGIENAEQVARLQELGCELGQGYHFARPLPSNEATELLVAGLPR